MKVPDCVIREMVHGAEKVIPLSPFSGESLWRGMEVLQTIRHHKELLNGFQLSQGVSVGSLQALEFSNVSRRGGSVLADETLKVVSQKFSAPAENLGLSVAQLDQSQSLISRLKGETNLVSLYRKMFSS